MKESSNIENNKPLEDERENENQSLEQAAVSGGSESETNSKNSGSKTDRHKPWAITSICVAIAAWIILMFDGYVALGLGVVTVICGILGLRSRNKSLHNLSTASIVAGGVLCVVIAAFLMVIYIGLNAI